MLTSLDGTEGCHGGDGAGRRGQEEGHMGLDGGLGLERREREDIWADYRKKKRPNPKSPEGPGFGGPTVVQSFHRREWATLCMADAYIKLGESIKKKYT